MDKLCDDVKYSPAEYLAAVKEFDLIWETGTTREQQRRMVELLKHINVFESRNSELRS